MAVISLRQLFHLPVETERGLRLGFVVDVEFNIESQTLVHLVVQKHRLAIVGKPFLIARDQIVGISSEKVVVKDTAVRAAEPVVQPVPETGVSMQGNLSVTDD